MPSLNRNLLRQKIAASRQVSQDRPNERSRSDGGYAPPEQRDYHLDFTDLVSVSGFNLPPDECPHERIVVQCTSVLLSGCILGEIPLAVRRMSRLRSLIVNQGSISPCMESRPVGSRSLCANHELGKWIDINGARHIPELTSLTCLKLSGVGLRSAPVWLRGLVKLLELDLSENEELGAALDGYGDDCMGGLTSLTCLKLSTVGLGRTPAWLKQLVMLRDLDLSGNEKLGEALYEDGADCMRGLTALACLKVAADGLGSAPVWLTALVMLRELDLSWNERLGAALDQDGGHYIGELTTLTKLDISQIGLSAVPSWLRGLVMLQELNIVGNMNRGAAPGGVDEGNWMEGLSTLTCLKLLAVGLTAAPVWLKKLVMLRELDLSENQELGEALDEHGSDCMRRLTTLTCLKFSHIGLRAAPVWLKQLVMLKEVDLSENWELGEALGKHGDDFMRGLTTLTCLKLAAVGLVTAPVWLTALVMLRELDLSYNEELGAALDQDGGHYIGELTTLTKLNISQIGLSAVPSWLRGLLMLQELNIALNVQDGTLSGVDDDNWIGRLSALTCLKLSDLGLTTAPVWLSGLMMLLELDLSENLVGKALDKRGYDCIGGLTTLTCLKLSSVGLTAAPVWLSGFMMLSELNLSDNQKLGEALDMHGNDFMRGLTALTCLKLSDVGLRAAPVWLSGLVMLQELDLSLSEELGAALDEYGHHCIGGLTTLTSLNLSDIGLGAAPVWLSGLVMLWELDVSGNAGLGAALDKHGDDCIGGLTKLLRLKLATVGLGTVPVWLRRLVMLQELDLQGNEKLGTILVEDCGAFIGELVWLTNLNLHNVGCKVVPSAISTLVHLNSLDLGGNKFESLPFWLSHLTELQDLDLAESQDLKTPPLVVRTRGTKAMLEYLKDLSKGEVECHLLKVMTLGPPKVGVEVKQTSFVPGSRLVINAFDAGGHEVYLATHHLFMSSGALYLCVVDLYHNDTQGLHEDVLKWMEILQANVPNAVVAIVGTHIDRLKGEDVDALEEEEEKPDVDKCMKKLQVCVEERMSQYLYELQRCLSQEEKQFEPAGMRRGWQALQNARDNVLDRLHMQWEGNKINKVFLPGQRKETALRKEASKFASQVVQSGFPEHVQLESIHSQMKELEGNKGSQDLYRQRVVMSSLPKLVLLAGVSCKTGEGIKELTHALDAISRRQEIFPDVGAKVPLDYMILEQCCRQDKSLMEQQIGGGPREVSGVQQNEDDNINEGMLGLDRKLANHWDEIVRQHKLTKRNHVRLEELLSKPHVQLDDLMDCVLDCDMTHDVVMRALVFLHETGSVLFYGKDAVDQVLAKQVFTQPQWIIDAIKYVIHEQNADQTSNEIRDLLRSCKQPGMMTKCECLVKQGKLCSLLLRERLWSFNDQVCDKFPRESHDVLIRLLKSFKLIKEVHAPRKTRDMWCQVCNDERHESYIVPSMFCKSLDEEYACPKSVWCPAMSKGCKAVVRRMYVASRLPDAMLSALQVQWSVEAKVWFEVKSECKNGSVLVSQLEDNVQTVVVSLEHQQGGMRHGEGDKLCIVGWVHLTSSCESVWTNWELFTYVIRTIDDALKQASGVYVQEFIPCVDENGKVLEHMPFREAEAYEGHFMKELQPESFVRVDTLMPVGKQLRPDTKSPCNPEGVSSRSAAKKRRLNPRRKRVPPSFPQTATTPWSKWEVYSFNCRISTNIGAESESQDLMDLFKNHKDKFVFCVYPMAQSEHFADLISEVCDESCTAQGVVIHFVGHSQGGSGLWWSPIDKIQGKPNPVSGECMAKMVSLNAKGALSLRRIECVFLNTCTSLSIGLALRDAGIAHVICWLNEVSDQVGIKFAVRFYKLLIENPGNYALAFEKVCAEMGAGIRPCLLRVKNDQTYGEGVQMWDGRELTRVPEELRGTAQTSNVGPASSRVQQGDRGGAQVDDAQMADVQQSDELRGWLEGNTPSSLAGRAEKACIKELGIPTKLNGQEISVGNGVVGKDDNTMRPGSLTAEAVVAITGCKDKSSYQDLWGSNGFVVSRANQLLMKDGYDAWHQKITRAAQYLNTALYNRKKAAGKQKAAGKHKSDLRHDFFYGQIEKSRGALICLVEQFKAAHKQQQHTQQLSEGSDVQMEDAIP